MKQGLKIWLGLCAVLVAVSVGLYNGRISVSTATEHHHEHVEGETGHVDHATNCCDQLPSGHATFYLFSFNSIPYGASVGYAPGVAPSCERVIADSRAPPVLV